MDIPDRARKIRVSVALAVILGVALAHAFRLGSTFQGDLYSLYYSFASDIILPLAAYFLLVLSEATWAFFLRSRWLKALLVFAGAAIAEILQGFGIPALGVTFDPLDFGMYALGAFLAMLLDSLLLPRTSPRPEG